MTERTVGRWVDGSSPVPDGVRIEIEEIEAHPARCVGEYVAALMDLPDPGIYTYRRDADLWAARQGMEPYPAAWHRAIVARVAQEVPALTIEYAPD